MVAKRIPHKFENGLEYKRCSKCTTYKILEEFGSDLYKWDKKYRNCKCCMKKYRKENKEKIKEQKQRYIKENKGKIKAQRKQYRSKPETKAKKNKRSRERYEKDPEYRLRTNLRRRLHHALKAQGIKKTVATMKLCGCTLNTLKRHIEKQFTDGMSWNLRSSFHIDHIIPCSAFDLSDEIEQRACFWYRNLQPLPPSINMSKNAKFKVEDKDRLIQAYKKSKKNIYNSNS